MYCVGVVAAGSGAGSLCGVRDNGLQPANQPIKTTKHLRAPLGGGGWVVSVCTRVWFVAFFLAGRFFLSF